jgi:hypothetical protein
MMQNTHAAVFKQKRMRVVLALRRVSTLALFSIAA